MQLTPTFGHNDYEVLQREIMYQGVFRLVRFSIKHRLFQGGWTSVFSREVLERYSAAAVLPYDPALDRVILIEQFRPGAITDPQTPWLIEIPAGVISKNESPEELAHREAQEEAGCILTELKPISATYVSPGGSNEFIHIFCGKVDASNINGVHGLPEEHENIRVINLSAEEAFQAMEAGKIKTMPALIALLWLQVNRASLQKAWA